MKKRSKREEYGLNLKIYIKAIFLLQIIKSSTQVKKLKTCDNKYITDLNYPLKRGKFSPEFKFFDINDPKIQKIEENHFRIIEKIGIVRDNGITYKLTQADIFSPSLHKISGKGSSLELQIKGFDEKSEKSFTQVILFEKANIPFIYLFKIGIGRGVIRKLSRKEDDFNNSFITLYTTLNFSPYLEGEKRFLRYEGNDFNGKKGNGNGCPRSVFNVLFERLWVGEGQLEEFGLGGFEGIGVQRTFGSLYANFEAYGEDFSYGVEEVSL